MSDISYPTKVSAMVQAFGSFLEPQQIKKEVESILRKSDSLDNSDLRRLGVTDYLQRRKMMDVYDNFGFDLVLQKEDVEKWAAKNGDKIEEFQHQTEARALINPPCGNKFVPTP